MKKQKTSKQRNLQTSPGRRILSRVALVCAATAIGFSFYYGFHHDIGRKDHSRQDARVVRQEISGEHVPTAPPLEDFNYAVGQDPTIHHDTPKNAVPNARQPSDQLSGYQGEMTIRTPRAPVEKIKGSSGGKDFLEKPEYSDAEPPTLLSIAFDPKEAPPGTNVIVYIHATDNLSGVNSVAGKVKSPSGTATVPFSCQKSDENGSFVGVIEIPDRAETGTWSIASLRITDKVQNLKNYSENDRVVRTAHFEVVGPDSDNTPPIIVSVDINPYEVRGGDKVNLVVEAEDDQSGVARVHGSLISPSLNARFSIACRKTGEDNIFTGQAQMPKDAESGEWNLYYIRTEDEAKNTKMYYRNNYPELFGQATVRVFSESSDAQPPTLDDLTISPTGVAYGEHIEIIVSASDDVSGISRVFGRLRSPSGKAQISFSCTHHGGSDTYSATVDIKNNSEVGLWTVEYIRTVDKARNYKVYGRENPLVANASFEVTGEP
jgi:hypothetical protein